MGHFARVSNGVVTQVIVAEPEFIESFSDLEPGQWIQTSYNTKANTHLLGGTPLRGNYAGVGYTYDEENDVFYPPSPFPSWSLNQTTWAWEAPTAMPNDGKTYVWNEETASWDEVPTADEE